MPLTVLVIGCGIAGPVVSILLKRKGYNPIVFEKVRELGDAGASLMLMPNGLKVLQLVNLANQFLDATVHLTEFRDETSNGETLGISPLPSTLLGKYGHPAAGVKRTAVNLALKQLLIENDIEIHEGCILTEIEETDDGVVAVFEGRYRVSGAFLIGCDGIKAATRRLLLKKRGLTEGAPLYTGLTQTSGISPTPHSFEGRSGLLNVYGPSAHFISYPISHTHSSWAITLPEAAEAPESWHSYHAEEMSVIKSKLHLTFAEWSRPVPELIKNAERILKFGLYDRKELTPEQWHSERCILLGDAAHPTSPHLGQGANQALEDCYHLSCLLPAVDSSMFALSRQDLASIFQTFAAKRQPRTAALVKGARAQGERRIVTGGPAACLERGAFIKKGWLDQDAVEAKYDYLFREPF